jgi:hypothetical protein
MPATEWHAWVNLEETGLGHYFPEGSCFLADHPRCFVMPADTDRGPSSAADDIGGEASARRTDAQTRAPKHPPAKVLSTCATRPNRDAGRFEVDARLSGQRAGGGVAARHAQSSIQATPARHDARG